MKISRILFLALGLLLIFNGAWAQTENPLKNTGGSYSKRASSSERAKMIGTTIDTKTLPIQNNKYNDERLKQLEQEMKEKNWGSESTAWAEARAADTKEAYQRYIAMYPYGEHSPDANKRLIDLKVNDAFNSKHESLPGMNHVFSDPESPTSTVVVENATNQSLTVLYSGPESKSVTIFPGRRESVTLKNGPYRIAASVPSPSVRPYAGCETFTGGRYEVGYIIVHRY